MLPGIGENGHLAFNDPPVANFEDIWKIKLVRLDDPCKMQQVREGHFPNLETVPPYAFSLTIPALCSAKEWFVSLLKSARPSLSRRASRSREPCLSRFRFAQAIAWDSAHRRGFRGFALSPISYQPIKQNADSGVAEQS